LGTEACRYTDTLNRYSARGKRQTPAAEPPWACLPAGRGRTVRFDDEEERRCRIPFPAGGATGCIC